MASMTLSVPDELRQEMALHPEMNWSEVARQAIRDRLILLEKMDKMLSGSKLTQKDALEIGRRVSRGSARKFAEVVK
jgi:hypothetical protein